MPLLECIEEQFVGEIGLALVETWDNFLLYCSLVSCNLVDNSVGNVVMELSLLSARLSVWIVVAVGVVANSGVAIELGVGVGTGIGVEDGIATATSDFRERIVFDNSIVAGLIVDTLVDDLGLVESKLGEKWDVRFFVLCSSGCCPSSWICLCLDPVDKA